MSEINKARDTGSIPDGEKALIGQILARVPFPEWVAKDLEPLYDYYCHDPELQSVATELQSVTKARRDAEVGE